MPTNFKKLNLIIDSWFRAPSREGVPLIYLPCQCQHIFSQWLSKKVNVKINLINALRFQIHLNEHLCKARHIAHNCRQEIVLREFIRCVTAHRIPIAIIYGILFVFKWSLLFEFVGILDLLELGRIQTLFCLCAFDLRRNCSI